MASYSGRERSTEASIVAQGRIDIRTLAEMVVYFERVEYNRIGTMSQLLSDSLEYLRTVVYNKGLLPQEIPSIEEAAHVLRNFGLLKGKYLSRNDRKMMTARAFEEVRREGGDPKYEAPMMYNRMHNSNSVKASEYASDRIDRMSGVDMEKMLDNYNKILEKEQDKHKQEQERIAKSVECVIEGKKPGECVERKPKDGEGKRMSLKMEKDRLSNELMSGVDETREKAIVKRLEAIEKELDNTVGATGVRD